MSPEEFRRFQTALAFQLQLTNDETLTVTTEDYQASFGAADNFPCPALTFPRQEPSLKEFQALSPKKPVGPGQRVEGPDGIDNPMRGCLPYEAPFRLDQRRGVSCQPIFLGHRYNTPGFPLLQRFQQKIGPHLRHLVVQTAKSLVSFEWKLLLGKNRTRVHSGIQQHNRYSGPGFPSEKTPLHRGRTAKGRQQRGVDIQRSERKGVEERR
jgi:hypothetical protein